jgi:hypothetical protein
MVGLIDHVSDGEIDTPYTARRMVVEGPLPFTAVQEGTLPLGMEFDAFTGILSGTPVETGEFSFSVTVSDGTNPPIAKNFTLAIAEVGADLPQAYLVDTSVSPAATGTATGDGSFGPGSLVTLQATPAPGFRFLNWTENGAVISTNPSHGFTLGDINRSLVANFVIADVPTPIVITRSGNPGMAFAMEWSLLPAGWNLQESPDMSPGSWIDSTRADAPHDGLHHVEVADPAPQKRFFRLIKP